MILDNSEISGVLIGNYLVGDKLESKKQDFELLLDKFFVKNISEDNVFFEQIMDIVV